MRAVILALAAACGNSDSTTYQCPTWVGSGADHCDLICSRVAQPQPTDPVSACTAPISCFPFIDQEPNGFQRGCCQHETSGFTWVACATCVGSNGPLPCHQ